MIEHTSDAAEARQLPLTPGAVAIVTGAARGLGAAIADRLRACGGEVVGVDLSGSDLDLDIGSREGNEQMVAETLARHGHLDVLVLNAGVQSVAPIGQAEPDEWDRLHDVMLKGPFLSMKAAWPHLAKAGGRIVVVSSTSGVVAEPDKAPYVSAKAGVLGLVRTAALEGARDGVAVNAVAPGWMRTQMVEAQIDAAVAAGTERSEALATMLARQPVKRFVEAQEVASAVVFLAGPAASGITGACLPVDLGLLAS